MFMPSPSPAGPLQGVFVGSKDGGQRARDFRCVLENPTGDGGGDGGRGRT